MTTTTTGPTPAPPPSSATATSAAGQAATAAGAPPGGPAVQPHPLPASPSMRHRTRRRARDLVTGTLGRPRFVSHRPPALLEHIAYARSGEWATERDGPRRAAALIYAWLVAIPLATAGYLLAWVSARPGRFATALLVTTTVVLALSEIARVLVGWSR